MNSNISKYIDLYNELDSLLNIILWISWDQYVNYKDKLYQIKNWNYNITHFVRKFFDELLKFWYIRNELVHKYQNYIDITESTIINIKKYIDIIRNPKTCYDAFKVDVFFCNENDSLIDVIKVMKQSLFTHIPVYDSNNNFKWILTESSITYFIWEKIENDWILLLENVRVLDLNLNNSNDLFIFINRKTTIYEIEDLFYNSIKENKRLWAIFITNLWKNSEKIDWIITAWDIPKIKDLYL